MTPAVSERVLILTPTGRDAVVATNVLAEAKLRHDVCAGVPELVRELDKGAGIALVSDEAMRGADIRALADWIRNQPPWSDLPFLILTRQGGYEERNPAAARLMQTLGNVTFLERPFHPTTLVGAAQAALRGRRRQYEARERLITVREAEERLRIAMDAGHLGAWTFNLADRSFETSAACRSHFGRGGEDPFTWQDFLSAIHDEDREALLAAARATAAGEGDYDVGYRVIWPDGSLHWIEARGRLRRDAAGRPATVVGVTADVTERRLADIEREALVGALSDERAALEQRVEERTADLIAEMSTREAVQEQLRQAQKIEVMGQLVGGVAHDFNNLLMVVLGNLDLLSRRVPEDDRLARLIDGAMQGARRGAALTQRLLAFARRQDLQPKPTDLRDLVSGMSGLIERSVGPLVTLSVEAAPTLPPVRIDPNQLEMALLNLAVNARDAMPEGGTLTIRLNEARLEANNALRLEPGEYVRLAVRDTGLGMDADTLKQAIDPFFSTKGVGKGTGLGLSMVHGLAQQSGGAFRLQSEPGKGASAELWLPVAEGEIEGVAPAAVPDGDARPARIMLVDDDALIAMSAVEMLRELGHSVIEANSASEALGALQALEGDLDLLITDHAMPGMTGAELAVRVRALRPDLPILLATGYAELSDADGPNLPRLSKPYTQAELAAEIRRLLPSREPGLH
ncbi:MAG: response regulator [Caulobacteraceae bacterium]|nr:response regulator [Caulobacteraceae bacterium]